MGTFFSQYFDEDVDLARGDMPRPRDKDGTGSPSCGLRSRTRPSWTLNETPQPRVVAYDPRSPSDGITRTPIEVFGVPRGHKATYESHHTKSSDEHTPHSSKDNFPLIDPRSPACGLDFIRTPIQVCNLKFLDKSDTAEEINNEEFEHISYVEETEDGYRDASCTAECTLHETLITESAVEDHHHDASHTAEDIEQVMQEAVVTESAVEEHHDASHSAQVSQEALVTESNGKDRDQVESAQERVHGGEISQATNVDYTFSVAKNTSEVETPVKHTVKTDRISTLRIDDLKKGILNTSLYSLDTPKSVDRAQRFIVDKENSSSLKKQMFHSPEIKADDGVKPKVRTPLGFVCDNNSPMQMLRDKQSNIVKKSLSSRPTQFTRFNRTSVDRP